MKIEDDKGNPIDTTPTPVKVRAPKVSPVRVSVTVMLRKTFSVDVLRRLLHVPDGAKLFHVSPGSDTEEFGGELVAEWMETR